MFGRGVIVPCAMRSRMRPETVGCVALIGWSGFCSP